jgi:hypothetical protein
MHFSYNANHKKFMRNIPEDNLKYPVLITFNNGFTGSGFILKHGANRYFITASHVLFDKDVLKGDKVNLFFPTSVADDGTGDVYEVDLKKLYAKGYIYKHTSADVAAILIDIFKPQQDNNTFISLPIDHVKPIYESTNERVSVEPEGVSFLKDVLISNDVYLFGYPTSLGLEEPHQFDYSKPLLRKGIVAGVYKAQGTIILDCPVYSGNSGGPVIQIVKRGNEISGKIIGVVSTFIPHKDNWADESNGKTHSYHFNSGYSVAVAMDNVFEMLGIPMTEM